MKEDTSARSEGKKPAGRVGQVQALASSPAKLEWLYAQSKAGRWGLSRERFAASLERSAEKRLARG